MHGKDPITEEDQLNNLWVGGVDCVLNESRETLCRSNISCALCQFVASFVGNSGTQPHPHFGGVASGRRGHGPEHKP